MEGATPSFSSCCQFLWFLWEEQSNIFKQQQLVEFFLKAGMYLSKSELTAFVFTVLSLTYVHFGFRSSSINTLTAKFYKMDMLFQNQEIQSKW